MRSQLVNLIKTSADLCRLIYEYDGDPKFSFDRLITQPYDVYIGLKKMNGIWYVCFRGSDSFVDWIHNLEAWMIDVPKLGYLHNGFYLALPYVLPDIFKTIGSEQYVITGHSRGAAEATLFTAAAIVAGKSPLARVVFGEPLSGDYSVASIVRKVPGVSYCNVSRTGNESDFVTQVPWHIPFLAPYVRAHPLTNFSNDPGIYDEWPCELRFHHMQLYQQSLGGALA